MKVTLPGRCALIRRISIVHVQGLGQRVHLAPRGLRPPGDAEAAECAGHGVIGVVEASPPDVRHLRLAAWTAARDNGGSVGGAYAPVSASRVA